MKILFGTRGILQFAGVIPFDCRHSSIVNSVQCHLMIGSGMFILISVTISVIYAKTFVSFLGAFYIVSGIFGVIIGYIMLTRQRLQIIKFIEDLEATINARAESSPINKLIYDKANDNVEKFTKYSVLMTLGGMFAIVLVWTLTLIWVIESDDHTIDELPLLIPLA